MTWITLHLQDGSPVDINMALIVGIVTQKDGPTRLLDVVDVSGWRVTETRDQIRALIAEAKRKDRESRMVDVAEPPKIDARKIEEMCEALQRESQFLGECPIEKPMAMDKHQRRVDDIRAAIRKELGL